VRLDRTTAARMLRFGAVGVSGILVNQGALMCLHGSLGLPLLLSSIVAIETSILTNFFLNTRWTWKADLQGSLRNWVRKALEYHAATAFAALAGNVAVLLALVHLLATDYRIANLIGIAAGSGLNYAAAELLIFRKVPRRAS
jgi:dolichol-phosphate mannosyltransferase